MVEVTRNGKIPLFQIHYGFIEVLKFLIVFSYHQKNNLGTCLARSFEEVLPRKLQLNGKLKLLELNFFENANKKLDKFGYQNRKNDLPTNSPTNDPN